MKVGSRAILKIYVMGALCERDRSCATVMEGLDWVIGPWNTYGWELGDLRGWNVDVAEHGRLQGGVSRCLVWS